MKRRSFLKSSLAAGLSASAIMSRSSAAAEAVGAREYYELRTYSLKPEKQPLLDEYLSKAFIPALTRFGIGPVGAFSEKVADKFSVHLLIVFSSAEQALTLTSRLAADAEYQGAAASYLAAVAADPVYDRIDSSLLAAIPGMPKLEKPDATKPRLLNLRIYESHNERAAQKKIEMFNTRELPIFRRVGLTPVLFGEAIVGARLPNLTYLLVFPDDEARTGAWKRFGSDDDWKQLKAMPEYADKEIVSKITNKLLTPLPYSGL
jgi:hypothetical protein